MSHVDTRVCVVLTLTVLGNKCVHVCVCVCVANMVCVQGKTGGKVEEEPPQKKPTRLAIGVEGGFEGGVVEKAEYEDHTSIVILPEYQTIPLPSPDLPQKVGIVCVCVRACV